MDKTRTIFFGLIAASLVGVGVAAYSRYGTPASAPIAPVATGVKSAAEATGQTVAKNNLPQRQLQTKPSPWQQPLLRWWPILQILSSAQPDTTEPFAPIFAKTLTKDLPKYVCGAYSLGSYHTLAQMQQSGIDVKYDFHLGIVPFYLNEKYTNSEADRAKMLQDGKIDCLITSLDSVAKLDHGVITGIVDESAGADQIWARDVATINDLKGKRIAFEADGPSAYFAHYILHQVGLEHTDVTMMPMATVNEAIAAFNDNKADAVVGWEPNIYDAERTGGKLLVSTREFRSIIDVIVTNRDIIEKRSKVVEHFHEAWFEALQAQVQDFNSAATAVATWGNNEWTGISPDTAADDWRGQLSTLAQANMLQSKVLMSNPDVLTQRIKEARELIGEGGDKVSDRPLEQTVNTYFVLHAIEELESIKAELNIAMVNTSFTLGQGDTPAAVAANPGEAQPTAEATTSAGAETLDPAVMTEVAKLPCSRFEFIPNTTKLMPDSQKLLDECAVKTLRSTTGVLMRVKASSAWPGPKGTFSQQQVEEVAEARARAIADYLTQQGISADRFIIEFVLPPENRRETTDLALQAQDRYVELALLVAGL